MLDLSQDCDTRVRRGRSENFGAKCCYVTNFRNSLLVGDKFF